ncbi:MAG: zinc-binding dehydrogenase [Anaerolineales bacterium]
MKALYIKAFGGPEVFEVREAERPQPGPNELLVRVHATSINPVDIKIRQAGEWAGIEPPAIIGYDVSGVVEEVGPGVSNFKIGDAVYYSPLISGESGSYAEYHAVDESIAAHKPEPLSHVEAAGLPLAGMTAWDGLIEKAALKVGEAVLIHGAGGVGSLALQLAKAAGAYVIVSCSGYMVEQVEALGADRAIDHAAADFTEVVMEETDGFGVDVVLDTVGGDLLTRSLPVTKPFGRMAGIVSTDAGFQAAFHKNLTLYPTFMQRERFKLDALRVLVERGELQPVIDSVIALEEIPEAQRRLWEEGGVRGKIVVKIVGDPDLTEEAN